MSGQASATIYTSLTNISSASDFTDATKWAVSTCSSASVASSGGTIVPTATDYFVICNGYSLTFPTAYTINFGRLTFNTSGTWNSGVLKFGAGNKEIRNLNSSLSSIALDVSNMTTGNTISIISTGSPITFSSVTGGSLDCPVGTPYTAGNPISVGTACTVTAAPPPPAVSAPILDLKPAQVFATEVEQ